MWGKVLGWAFKTALGRWVTMGAVALLLGGAALKWHNHKEGLKEEGRQECVQEINQATVDALLVELENERAANAALNASLAVAADANRLANERRDEAVSNLRTIEAEMRTQEETDETYREWSADPLPDGVADRLRRAAAGSEPDSNDSDGS